MVVLANAMFLQASWKLAFERAYRPGSFTLADGTTVETDYMLREARFPLSRDSDPLAVELPYRGDELGMVIVQPADLAAFEEELSAERLLKIAGSLSDSKIDLRVPLWSTKTGLNARGPLQELGLPRTYDFGTMVDPATLVRFGGRTHHRQDSAHRPYRGRRERDDGSGRNRYRRFCDQRRTDPDREDRQTVPLLHPRPGNGCDPVHRTCRQPDQSGRPVSQRA